MFYWAISRWRQCAFVHFLWAITDHKRLTENAGHEIAGHENTGHEFARQDKYRMKIDYITLECAFLLNFKIFCM